MLVLCFRDISSSETYPAVAILAHVETSESSFPSLHVVVRLASDDLFAETKNQTHLRISDQNED